MEQQTTRALRRHHAQRLKKHRATYYGRTDLSPDSPEGKRHCGLVVNTAKLCSCVMCGNPRKYYNERSIQELSFMGLAASCWKTGD